IKLILKIVEINIRLAKSMCNIYNIKVIDFIKYIILSKNDLFIKNLEPPFFIISNNESELSKEDKIFLNDHIRDLFLSSKNELGNSIVDLIKSHGYKIDL